MGGYSGKKVAWKSVRPAVLSDNVKIVVRSHNKKTRGRRVDVPVASTFIGARACLHCPFSHLGIDPQAPLLDLPAEAQVRPSAVACYAHSHIKTRNIADNGGTDAASAFAGAVRRVLPGSLLRHATGGDPSAFGYMEAAAQFHAARPDVTGWGYTHAWRRVDPAEVQGWTCLASVESEAAAAEAIAAGWDPAMTVSPHDPVALGEQRVVAGRPVVVCPAQTHKDVGCADCRLCIRPRMEGWVRPVIAFITHGQSWKATAAIAAHARRTDDGVPVPWPHEGPVTEPTATHEDGAA